jgi:hypothetical protein
LSSRIETALDNIHSVLRDIRTDLREVAGALADRS